MTSRSFYLLAAALLLSGVLNVLLSRRASLGVVRLPETRGDSLLRVGEPVPTIKLTNLNGSISTLNFKSVRPSIIYWFAVDCSYCDLNKPNIDVLEQKSGTAFDIYPVSTAGIDQLAAYEKRSGIKYQLFSISSATALALGLSGEPDTLLIGRDGKVEERWTGAYTVGIQDAIEKRFEVSLPGARFVPDKKF